MNAQLVIPAAGWGRRLGLPIPKALVEVGGRRLIALTLERLSDVGFAAPAVIIVPPGQQQIFADALAGLPVPVRFVEGGAERRQSVQHGLEALDAATDIVAIHDAARPFAPVAAVRDAIEAARRCGAATLATPVADTILQNDGAGFLESTPDRARLWACQTPQVFRVDIIRQAHKAPENRDIVCTDDATLVRRIGCPVQLVDGGAMNFKITTEHDLAFASYLLEQGLL